MKKTTPARIVVTRTPAINELLQEAWMLSPELKEKISLTVHQAIAAFVRERRRYSAFASESLSPLSGNKARASRGKGLQGEEDLEREGLTMKDAKAIQREEEPHPDSIWNA